MPAKQPLGRQRLGIVLRGVQHHFDDAFDVAIGFDQTADIHAQAAGNGGANLLPVEQFALDLARFENIFGQGMENGFLTQRETKRLHAAD